MISLKTVFRRLLRLYGPQGWWPLYDPRRGMSRYHHGHRDPQRLFFEVSLGAILTQNVAWSNVEKALSMLSSRGLIDPVALEEADPATIGESIRSTGYYNQKARKIKNFLQWYRRYGLSPVPLRKKTVEEIRGELLAINGIGPETADSILLYGLGRRIFVVDAYTLRLFQRLGYFTEDAGYHEVQRAFHEGYDGGVDDCKEFHALIVRHARECCRKRPLCGSCLFRNCCLAFF
jgi:endonuclease III related protein